jgi:hypothetical protein
VALREFELNPGHGTADDLLWEDGKAAGILEAKKKGATLTGVDAQSARYALGLPAAQSGFRPPKESVPAGSAPQRDTQAFRCDGRPLCSQMSSCDEAKYFLRNCPGTQMDVDGDGIPCESQWRASPF